MPIIKERRRFTDVMEEESTTSRESRLTAWGRDDFSVYKMHKSSAQETVEIQVELHYVRYSAKNRNNARLIYRRQLPAR